MQSGSEFTATLFYRRVIRPECFLSNTMNDMIYLHYNILGLHATKYLRFPNLAKFL